MKRTRLTQRRNAADMSIPYPGNVNQPDRKDPAMDQYHTFEQQVNHELPDMRTEWKDDSRDEIGFGMPEKNPPTVASIRVAANKAVRIAVLLLGEKVSDETIEAQARDLMALSQESMDRTLDRFAQTQKLYSEEEKVEEKKEEKKEASAGLADKNKEVPKAIEAPKKAEGEEKKEEKVEEKKAEDKVEEKKEEKKAEDKAEEKKEEKVEEKKAADEKKMPDFIKEKIEEKKEKEEKKDASSKKSEDEEEEEEEEEKTAKAAGEMDIELTGSMDEVASDPKADAQLASLFDDDFTAAEEEDEEKAEKKAKKAGIKKLGGQPKVASTQNAGPVDISSIWNSAPDVSEIFR